MSGSKNYQLGGRRYLTRGAEALDAMEKSTQEKVLYWTLRLPLSGPDASLRFVGRMDQIRLLTSGIPRIRTYGVDSSGTAYLVTDFAAGQKLVQKTGPVEYLTDLFLEVLKIAVMFHTAGLPLGDLCEDSFIINARGKVLYVSLTGVPFNEVDSGATITAPNALHYFAPELLAGASADFSTDVFALGIIGYRLFAGQYPLGDRLPAINGSTPDPLLTAYPPSASRSDLPAWVDRIIGACLDVRKQARFANASELLETVQQAIAEGSTPEREGRWSERGIIVRPTAESLRPELVGSHLPAPQPRNQPGTPRPKGPDSVANANSGAVDRPRAFPGGSALDDEEEDEHDGTTAPPKTANLVVVLAVGLAFGIFVTGIGLLMRGSAPAPEPAPVVAAKVENIPPDLQPAYNDLAASGVGRDQKKSALGRIASSDNPASFELLVSLAQQDIAKDVRGEAVRLIVKRIRDSGLTRSADTVQRWAETLLGKSFDPAGAPAFALLLKACDMTLPLAARRDWLFKAYAEDRVTALQLAAALALDDPEADSFAPVLRQLLLKAKPSLNLGDQGVGALIFSDRTLSVVFERDLAGMLASMSLPDLAWSLMKAAEEDEPLLPDLVREVLHRNIVPPFQAVFLDALLKSDKFSTPRNVKTALVRAARGEILPGDLEAFERWNNLSSEGLFLAVCAIAKDPDIALAAFDILANRSIDSQPAASLVTWVRDYYWDHRGRMVKAIGILGHSSIATDREIEYAFDSLMPFSASGSLLKVIVKSNDPRLIVAALKRVAQITPSEELVPLLQHQDREVREAAIRGLVGRNDVSTLQYIKRGYDKEQDPDVRELYRQLHWVIRDQVK